MIGFEACINSPSQESDRGINCPYHSEFRDPPKMPLPKL